MSGSIVEVSRETKSCQSQSDLWDYRWSEPRTVQGSNIVPKTDYLRLRVPNVNTNQFNVINISSDRARRILMKIAGSHIPDFLFFFVFMS